MAAAMATTVPTPFPPAGPSCPRTRLSVLSYSASASPLAGCPRTHLVVCRLPQPGGRHLCSWSGLKHLGISCRHRNRGARNRGGKERYMGRVYASLFGVGAPEALVIGVVALLVFGPKGLAEVARNLGKTLRAFQPTIRELQEVSKEFRDSLEREIGLDDISSSTNKSPHQSSSFPVDNPQATVDPNGVPSTGGPYYGETLVKLTQQHMSESSAAPQAQATNWEDQPKGIPDAPSSPEATDSISTSQNAASTSASAEAPTSISTSQTAGSASTSEVAARATMVENPENEGGKS